MRANNPRPDVDAALAMICDHARTLPQERVGAATAAGRILADAPRAVLPVPRFRASAMEGYALSSRSIGSASTDTPVELQLSGGNGAAGLAPPPLRDGEIAKIATGAPVPEGADAVLAREHARRASGRDDRLLFQEPIAAGRNVRTVGEDVQGGAELIGSGRMLTPAAIGLSVAAGVQEIMFRRWPRVRTISTGTELATSTVDLNDTARIPDSNGPMVQAALHELGLPLHRHHQAIDCHEALSAALDDPDADVFIATGSVSVGDFDLVPAALRSAGAKIHFNGIAMRPGKPILFATLADGRPFFGLPGDPVAAAVGFRFFVTALLRAMLGVPQEIGVDLHQPVPRRAGTTLFLRGKASYRDAGVPHVVLDGDQRSHILSSVVAADSWARADGDPDLPARLFPQHASFDF